MYLDFDFEGRMAMNKASRWFDQFRRITSSGRLIPEIDGLRFLAIFAVFVYHVGGDVMRHSSEEYRAAAQSGTVFQVAEFLGVGVPLFFVISGFILGLPFAEARLRGQSPVNLGRYFKRRITRLEPPYVVSLVLLYFVKIATGRGTAASLFPNLAASLLYVHNLVFARPSDINFVAWSLEIEVQFYILAPALAYVFAVSDRRRRLLLIAGLVVLATGVSRVVDGTRLELSLAGYAQYFLSGFLLTEVYLATGDRPSRDWRMDIVFVTSGALLLKALVDQAAVIPWLAPWLLLAMCIAGLHGLAANELLTRPGIATVGGMCYSIYLLHNYVIAAVGMRSETLMASASFPARLALQSLLTGVPVLVVCGVYFRVIERPCMRPDWFERLVSRLRRSR